MRFGLIGASALSALMPLAVQAETPQVGLGFADSDIALGAVAESAERPASASGLRMMESGDLEIHGLRFRGDSAVLSADRAVLRADGHLSLERGVITGLEGGKGISSFPTAEFSSDTLLAQLMLGDGCSPLAAVGRPGQSLGEVQLLGVVLDAPPTAAAMSAMRVAEKGPESIRIESLRISFEGIEALNCFMPARFDAAGIVSEAADGSRGSVSAISGLLNLLPQPGEPYSAELQARGMSSRDPAGRDLMAIEQTSASLSVDPAIIEGIRALPQMADEAVIPEIVRLVAAGNFDIRMSTTGLNMPLGELLSESQRQRLGARGDELITGDQEASIWSRGPMISISTSSELDGLANTHATLELAINPSASGGSAMALTGGHPVGVLLPYLQLSKLEFSVDDTGAWSMLEGATGRNAEVHLAGVTPLLRQAPSEVSAPIIAWLEGIARDGQGSVTMNPLEPVGFTDIIMGAMMNPAGLGRMLSVETP